jgi:hypothetical protein
VDLEFLREATIGEEDAVLDGGIMDFRLQEPGVEQHECHAEDLM